MTGTADIPRTRMGLLRAKNRLERLERGVTLLERKREALVSELFTMAREAVGARGSIGEAATKAYPALLSTLAARGGDGTTVSSWPLRTIEVDLTPVSSWGVTGSAIRERPTIRRTIEARGLPPGSLGPETALAARSFELLLDRLLETATREMLLVRLGQALAETSRQVNVLEQRVTPELRGRIAEIRARLDEREREEHVRLLRIRRKR